MTGLRGIEWEGARPPLPLPLPLSSASLLTSKSMYSA